MMTPALEAHAEKMRERYADGQRWPKRPLNPLMRIHAAVRERFKYEFNFPSQERRLVVPRQISMYLMRRLLPWASYPLIGMFYGGRHHVTVMYSVVKIEQERKLDENLDRLLAELEEQLKIPAVMGKAATDSESRRALIAYVSERTEGA